MNNPYDNPVPAPNYAAPLLNFSGLNPQQQQGQQSPYSLQNPNPNGLAARLMQYLNPPNLGNKGGTGGTGGNLGPMY